ncbi:hypothetical protein AB0L63_25365 [Nocardia sp. NPDC051990]|uniref:hypothetical protein n=1 Tax=Nocardia sp. NPDC051990 TaxID=3155285 RepID=UPI0034493B66
MSEIRARCGDLGGVGGGDLEPAAACAIDDGARELGEGDRVRAADIDWPERFAVEHRDHGLDRIGHVDE